MKFYEVIDPYYALIKAEDEVDAQKEYVKTVADDEGEELEINEVDRDYALVTFSRTLSEDAEIVPIKDVISDFQNDETMTLIVDGSLL